MDVVISHLCASTAKVRSFWMTLRIMLTSCGLKSCRGSVWPGTSITAVCGSTGMVWQLSSSWTVRPWNSSMSEPRYWQHRAQCQHNRSAAADCAALVKCRLCNMSGRSEVVWVKKALASLTACDVGRLGSKVMMLGFSASSPSRSSVSISFSSSSSFSVMAQQAQRHTCCLVSSSPNYSCKFIILARHPDGYKRKRKWKRLRNFTVRMSYLTKASCEEILDSCSQWTTTVFRWNTGESGQTSGEFHCYLVKAVAGSPCCRQRLLLHPSRQPYCCVYHTNSSSTL